MLFKGKGFEFLSNPQMAQKLIAVEGEIVEDNVWHDYF